MAAHPASWTPASTAITFAMRCVSNSNPGPYWPVGAKEQFRVQNSLTFRRGRWLQPIAYLNARLAIVDCKQDRKRRDCWIWPDSPGFIKNGSVTFNILRRLKSEWSLWRFKLWSFDQSAGQMLRIDSEDEASSTPAKSFTYPVGSSWLIGSAKAQW